MPITLKETEYPMVEGLEELFPTLINKGMKYFEIKAEDDKG